ncbi:MAG: ABC transporter ATP-binding protein [Patescibacteria group bacterium]|nr:ABC transporter ATP-binding protein/permease [Patescibacteria group bacterium]
MISGFQKYKEVYGHLWKTYGSSGKVKISFVLQIIARVCKLIILPIAISLIIARLSVQDFAGAYQAVFLFVAFSLALGVLAPVIKYVGMLGENKIYRSSMGDYFSRLINADMDYFHSNLAGYLTTATRQYVDSNIQLVRALRDRYINTILSILFPLIVILWVDRILGLVALALSAVQAVYIIWASHTITPFRTRSRELYKRNSGKIADVISNILAVRSAAKEDFYVEQVEKYAIDESAVFTKRYAVQAKLIAAREFITVSFFLLLLWLVVQRMHGGFIEITGAVLVVTYAGTILTGIYSLSEDLDTHDDLVDKVIPAFEILNRENIIKDPITPKDFNYTRGEIQINNVYFTYHKEQNNYDVFNNFSLHVPQGQKLGVVGLSGAGKTTLTKLLLRFEDVDKGGIFVDDIDVRDVRQSDLRRNIAYVPQEPILFHTSIKENILLSNPQATDDEITSALRAAHALEFVQHLPKSIDSIVGERGVKLSGGQKQRIAIARAVLQNAPIIILDEATSALDSESEQIIKDSFAEILKSKTAIVVAHRLSTLSEMDRIIVIEDGNLVEDGTHTSLIEKGGIYASMWKYQQRYQKN